MSCLIVVVDGELIESPLAPDKYYEPTSINYNLQLTYSLLHYHPSNRRTVQTAIALRREVTVPDFMQRNVDIIDLPTGVSLEAILLKPPATTHSEGTKLAICLHPCSWLGSRMEDPWVVHTPFVLNYTF